MVEEKDVGIIYIMSEENHAGIMSKKSSEAEHDKHANIIK